MLASQLVKSGQSVGKESEQCEIAFETQIIHSFGVVEAKSCSLTSTHYAHSDFSSSDGIKTDGFEFHCINLKILIGGDVRDGRELGALLILDSLSFDINVLI